MKEIMYHDQMGLLQGGKTGSVFEKSNNVIYHIKKLKEKNCMILSTNVEIIFDNVKTPIHKIRGEVFHFILKICIKIIHNNERQYLLPKIRRRRDIHSHCCYCNSEKL